MKSDRYKHLPIVSEFKQFDYSPSKLQNTLAIIYDVTIWLLKNHFLVLPDPTDDC
jgi:hypothetical protein